MNASAYAALKSAMSAECLKHSHLDYIASGGQSNVYRLTDPVCGQVLFLKLYKHEDREQATTEARALDTLRSAFASMQRKGIWNLDAPRPVSTCSKPSALVLTSVPGVELEIALDGLDPDSTIAAIEAFGAGLQAWWSMTGAIYGDVNLRNAICDAPSKTLYFLDPGPPNSEYECENVSRNFYPYSRDLAYLLFEVATTNVKLGLTSPSRANRRLQFAKGVLRGCCCSPHGISISALCDELWSCGEVNLARLERGAGLRGWWRSLVKRNAESTMARAIHELRSLEKVPHN